jgi:hypothetical protein
LRSLQFENEIDGNLLDPTVRSGQPPKLLDLQHFAATYYFPLIPLHAEKPAPELGAAKNYDSFYQFFE